MEFYILITRSPVLQRQRRDAVPPLLRQRDVRLPVYVFPWLQTARRHEDLCR